MKMGKLVYWCEKQEAEREVVDGRESPPVHDDRFRADLMILTFLPITSIIFEPNNT